MTLRNNLDEVDLKILDIITQNARIPFKDVAKDVGISRAAVHQRVNRMIELEVITGSGYHINPTKVDFKTCSYIGIFLEKGGLFSEVVEKLKLIPEIVECHYTTGQYAIFVKVYAKDNELSLQGFFYEDILLDELSVKGIEKYLIKIFVQVLDSFTP